MTTSAPPTPALFTRPNEVQLRVIRLCAGICRSCDKPLTEAVFCWNQRITDDMYMSGPWTLGEDSFSCLRHTDGTRPCWTASSDLPKPQCTACGAYDSVDVVQWPYGDRSTCRSCGHSIWAPIGD
jgi:hypothetical protein